MIRDKNHITVFEHEAIRFDKGKEGITEDEFNALKSYHGEGVPYFKLINNGIKFNEYVGVIQVGKTVIEVLPKADKSTRSNEGVKEWRDILIGMLRVVGSFDIKATSESNLKIKPNSILELYFEMFIKEVEYLLHKGLVKKYRKKEGNVIALKGSLQFGKNIQQNLMHQERFYVKYTTYNIEHHLHRILYTTICLLKQINTNPSLQGRIGALMLYFPEMSTLRVGKTTFDKLLYNRKTQCYKKAVEISKLILLNYHPDVSKGRNDVLALMFDMNLLWEKFIYSSLRKYKDECTKVIPQTSKFFWKPEYGNRSKIRPDIWIQIGSSNVIFDTKWKYINDSNPSPEDLRQMYVYHEYYNAEKVALIYPGSEYKQRGGIFLKKNTSSYDKDEKKCSVIIIPVERDLKKWQLNIKDVLMEWCKS